MLKKNIIANYFGQFYAIIIGIVMLPFYLKYLGAEAYGLVGFFALMQSWMMLLDMGISPTLSREVAKVKNETDNIVRLKFINLLHSLEFIFIIVSLFISLLIIINSNLITTSWIRLQTLDIDIVSYCISLMGAMIGLRLLSSLYRSGIVGSEEQVWLNKANSIIVTLKFVGVILVLHFISSDIKYFFEYQMIVTILEFFLYSFKFYNIMNIGKFKLYFSYLDIKPILPFAMGIAYTSGIWIFLTQLDKFILSGILPLSEYGYFALVGMVANAVLAIADPIGKAILPRMVSLHKNGQNEKMIELYKNSTQLVAIIVFSVTVIMSSFSYEFLYSWTGDIKASLWGENILFWYLLGNALLSMVAFTYYLQFTFGKLRLHIRYNTVSAIVSIPLIIWSANEYGALGVSLVWFSIRLISFLFWTPVVHNKFAKGIHRDWLMKDILPIFLSSLAFILMFNYLDISFDYNRGAIFGLLLLLGMFVLVSNILASSYARNIVVNFIKDKYVK